MPVTSLLLAGIPLPPSFPPRPTHSHARSAPPDLGRDAIPTPHWPLPGPEHQIFNVSVAPIPTATDAIFLLPQASAGPTLLASSAAILLYRRPRQHHEFRYLPGRPLPPRPHPPLNKLPLSPLPLLRSPTLPIKRPSASPGLLCRHLAVPMPLRPPALPDPTPASGVPALQFPCADC